MGKIERFEVQDGTWIRELDEKGELIREFFIPKENPSLRKENEEHGPELERYGDIAIEGEPLPSKYYKWSSSGKEKSFRFVLQRHYPTGRKIPIKPGEKVPEMHKGFVLEYDEEHPEAVGQFLSNLFEQFQELDEKEREKIEKSSFGFLFEGLLTKIRDHLDLRMEIGEKLSNGELIGYTIHPPVPGGESAWASFQERLKPDTKTQVTPKFKEGIPKDWLTREGKLYFPTRHKDVPEQEAHFIEVAQMDIVDKGEVKFGVQRKDLHEYFFFGKYLKGRWVVRLLKIGKEFQHEAWILMKPTDQRPMDPSYHKDEGYFKTDPIPGKVTTEEREHIEEEVHRAREARGEEV